jgi:hypothetical protein
VNWCVKSCSQDNPVDTHPFATLFIWYPHQDQEFAYSKGYQSLKPLGEDNMAKGLLR